MALTYAQLGDHIEGISLSLSGDVMFGSGKPSQQMETLGAAIERLLSFEAEKKGLKSAFELATLPNDTLLDPESEKMWEDICNKMDADEGKEKLEG